MADDYDFPDGCHYTRDDEWVRADGGVWRVGITDYAQQELGDVVFVELPEVGRELGQGEPFGVIESVKAVSDLFSPIAGRVAEINSALVDAPEKINESCYGDGWIIAIETASNDEVEQLLDADAYGKHVEERKE